VSETLDPAAHPWMTDARTRKVMDALTADGGEARFVGGAVRNALLGVPVTDVDIATPLPPAEVMRRLEAAGLGAVPTGIAHGTVTAIADSTPYEVTTLRRDVATDGRRAVVAFTTDWKEDASRRDFTMNALYADENGRVFDYFGGVADLRAGRVRFVGDPRTRIREDYLRILRLFRFHAWYGKGEIDADALAAAVAEKSGLKTLSGERVQKEFLRLLEAKDPVPVLRKMQGVSILAEILPGNASLERLGTMIAVIERMGVACDPILRLASLLGGGTETARNLAGRLRLSNADRDRLMNASDTNAGIDPTLTVSGAHKLIYRMGFPTFRDKFLLQWAGAGSAAENQYWMWLLLRIDDWDPPKFSIDGRDVKALGMSEGPQVGAILEELEQWWIDQDFKPGRERLLAHLRDLVQKRS
jgi:poly(A) polymerase